MEKVQKVAFNNTYKELKNSMIDIGLSGTTAVSIVIKGSKGWCLNCGDSRAILVNSKNNNISKKNLNNHNNKK